GHVSLPAAYVTSEIPPGSKYNTARALGESTAAQLSNLTGFGTFAPIQIRFNRPMVIDAGENPHGILIFEYDDLDARPPLFTATAYDPNLSIEVRPVVPLRPKTTYALV